MSILYVNEDSAIIGLRENRCYVTYKDGMIQQIPIENLDSITVMGHAQVTSACMVECLKRGVPIAFFSKGGVYFGRVVSTGHTKAERQRMQCLLYDTDFAVELAKRIMDAKVGNQIVVLRRYSRSRNVDVTKEIDAMKISQYKISQCRTITEITGYEGKAAKYYFEALSKLVEETFRFSGRNRRPPLDPFNSMLSLGYSIVMNEIYSVIENKGLNPYFGFIHRDHENHPTLASDLMEEWRAVLVDSLVMSLINGHEISLEEFYYDIDQPGCFINRDGLKIYIKRMEKKLSTVTKYIEALEYGVSFRNAMVFQMDSLIRAMSSRDAALYVPIRIR